MAIRTFQAAAATIDKGVYGGAWDPVKIKGFSAVRTG